MKLLGVDYGQKRWGLSLADASIGIARPLEPICAKTHQQRLSELGENIQTHRIDALVVGCPLNAEGEATPMSEAVGRFIQTLKAAFGLPVHPIDEHLSSQEARSRLAQSRGRSKSAVHLGRRHPKSSAKIQGGQAKGQGGQNSALKPKPSKARGRPQRAGAPQRFDRLSGHIDSAAATVFLQDFLEQQMNLPAKLEHGSDSLEAASKAENNPSEQQGPTHPKGTLNCTANTNTNAANTNAATVTSTETQARPPN